MSEGLSIVTVRWAKARGYSRSGRDIEQDGVTYHSYLGPFVGPGLLLKRVLVKIPPPPSEKQLAVREAFIKMGAANWDIGRAKSAYNTLTELERKYNCHLGPIKILELLDAIKERGML